MVTLVTLPVAKAGLTSHSDKELSPWAGDWRLCFTIWNDRFQPVLVTSHGISCDPPEATAPNH